MRSLKELTNNLTTRTDGSRATPVNDRAFEIAFAIFESDNRSCIVNMQYWFKITSETTPAPQLFSKTQQTPKDDAQEPLELPLKF